MSRGCDWATGKSLDFRPCCRLKTAELHVRLKVERWRVGELEDLVSAPPVSMQPLHSEIFDSHDDAFNTAPSSA